MVEPRLRHVVVRVARREEQHAEGGYLTKREHARRGRLVLGLVELGLGRVVGLVEQEEDLQELRDALELVVLGVVR
eukprot:1228616-Heterocapsa_arctica.AAC.1